MLRECCYDRIEQVTQIHCIRGRKRNRIAESQIIELIGIYFKLRAVDLIDTKDNRLLRAAQEPCHLFIRSRQTGTAIDQEKDDVCFVHGDLCLLAHGLEDMIAFVKLDTTGIDHGEFMIQPFRIEIDTVTGNARHIINDGYPFFTDLIEQRRFAHVRAANDGHDWFTHSITFFPSLFHRLRIAGITLPGIGSLIASVLMIAVPVRQRLIIITPPLYRLNAGIRKLGSKLSQ